MINLISLKPLYTVKNDNKNNLIFSFGKKLKISNEVKQDIFQSIEEIKEKAMDIINHPEKMISLQFSKNLKNFYLKKYLNIL